MDSSENIIQISQSWWIKHEGVILAAEEINVEKQDGWFGDERNDWEERNQKIKKGWCKLWKAADWKVPDQYNLIVALNPLMSWQDLLYVASLSVIQSLALFYALHPPLWQQAAVWSFWRRSEAALLDLKQESFGSPMSMALSESVAVQVDVRRRAREWLTSQPRELLGNNLRIPSFAFNAPLQAPSC